MMRFFQVNQLSRDQSDRLARLIAANILTKKEENQLTKAQRDFILQIETTFAILSGRVDIHKIFIMTDEACSYWKNMVLRMREEVSYRLSLSHIFELDSLCPLFLEKKLKIIFFDNYEKISICVSDTNVSLNESQILLLKKIMTFSESECNFIFGYGWEIKKLVQLNSAQRAIIFDNKKMQLMLEGVMSTAVVRPCFLEKEASYTPAFYQSVTRDLRDLEPEWEVIPRVLVEF